MQITQRGNIWNINYTNVEDFGRKQVLFHYYSFFNLIEIFRQTHNLIIRIIEYVMSGISNSALQNYYLIFKKLKKPVLERFNYFLLLTLSTIVFLKIYLKFDRSCDYGTHFKKNKFLKLLFLNLFSKYLILLPFLPWSLCAFY